MLTLNTAQLMKPDRVVVLGAGGFVGSASVKKLTSNGVYPVSLTRKEVDLLAPDAVARLDRHLTLSTTLIVTSALAPVKSPSMLLDNLRMFQAVVEAVKRKPVLHLIYVSSDAVYADSDGPITESSPAEPGSLHGVMHLARELILKNELAGIPQTFVRPTLIYGPGDPHNGYGPNRFLRQARAGETIHLFGEGEELRDHIFIEDVAEIIKDVVLYRATGIVNAVSGTVTSFREIAEMASARFESRVQVLGKERVGAMPHNGYRAFDAVALREAFPSLQITPLSRGMDLMKASL